MTKPPPYQEEKPVFIAYKTKEYYQRAKGVSFFVLLFSIFIYLSIFYIFNLSPSLNNTKLWFFISNTLILIIAADYGVFSSSTRGKPDGYEEYHVMHSQASSVSSSFFSQYPELVKKSVPAKEDVEINFSDKKEDINDQKEEHPVDKMEIVINRGPESKPNVKNFQEKKLESAVKGDNSIYEASDNEKKIIETKTYRRSNTEKPTRVLIDESKNISQRSSESEIERGGGGGEEEEEEEAAAAAAEAEDEYSTMSDEELNRRVEEFIQRFNRQIRLQRAGNFHQI